jgi:hypothetical protein
MIGQARLLDDPAVLNRLAVIENPPPTSGHYLRVGQ